MTQIIKIEKEVKPLLSKVESLKIKDESTLADATELLSQANTLFDTVSEQKKEETDPYEIPLKEIKKRYEPTEKALKNVIASIRSEMARYQTEVVQLRKAQELAIAGRVGPGRGKLRVETAITKLEQLEKPTTNVETNSGSLSFREKAQLKICDKELIPKEYLMPDEDKILSALKAGKTVPGAILEIVQVPINRRG